MSNKRDYEQSLCYIEKFNEKTITQAEFNRAVRFKFFRLCCFYYIKSKDGGHKIRFAPNSAQVGFFINSHKNDVILKARQLGFTTWKMIFDLDDCLFKKNYSAGCIAHNDKSAKDIYRDKIRFAYRNIKPQIVQMLKNMGYRFPHPVNDKDNGYVFSNGSSISVSTGYRGGTLQSLHVSELGKICKKFPERAKEIVSGAFNAVGKTGTKTVESTAEGKQGAFYDICSKAKALSDSNIEPVSMQFKFHFYPWHKDAGYTTDERIHIGGKLSDYFLELKSKHGVELTDGQKHWYALKEQEQGDEMQQEYPSTPEEAFNKSVEGAYYAKQMLSARSEGRICKGFGNDAPVNTAWDLGVGDSTAIWFYQKIGNEIHLIDYYENSGEGLEFYAGIIRGKGYEYGRHYAPHDIDNRDFSGNGKTRKELAARGFDLDNDGRLYKLRFEKVSKLGVEAGINYARSILKRCVFDIDRCARGIECLEAYRKEWNDKLGCFRDHPLHDWASDGADAFRYLAVAEEGAVPRLKSKIGISM